MFCRNVLRTRARGAAFVAKRMGQRDLASDAQSGAGLPIVDISSLVNSTSTNEMRATGQRIDDAFRTRGFMYVVGHGVPLDRLEETLSITRQFFALDSATKDKIATTKHDPSLSTFQAPARGYQRIGDNVTLGSPDWHEGVDFYRDCPPGDVLGLCESQHPLAGSNKWPEQPKDFEPVLRRHVDDMIGLGRSIMGGVALSMGADRRFFEGYFDDPFWIMRAIRYPPRTLSESDVELGCGRHTDYGFLTFVLADDTPGCLQVEDARRRKWLGVPPLDGAFVINCGDMLSRFSNGAYQSTPHRVLRPRDGQERISVPFFFEPNWDAMIRPLPQFCEAGNTDEEAVHYGDHLTKRVLSNFAYSPNLEKDNAERRT